MLVAVNAIHQRHVDETGLEMDADDELYWEVMNDGPIGMFSVLVDGALETSTAIGVEDLAPVRVRLTL